jgi:hypothetical protein
MALSIRVAVMKTPQLKFRAHYKHNKQLQSSLFSIKAYLNYLNLCCFESQWLAQHSAWCSYSLRNTQLNAVSEIVSGA